MNKFIIFDFSNFSITIFWNKSQKIARSFFKIEKYFKDKVNYNKYKKI